MKRLKRIISAITAAAILAGIMVIIPISASAAGVATRLQTLFEDDYQAKTPEMLTPDSAKESGLDPNGAFAWEWQIQHFDKGTKFGFPESAGNVYYARYNNPSYPSSMLSGKEFVFYGTQFRNHNNWVLYSRSIDEYTETASVAITVKVPAESESYYDDLYVYLKSYPNTTHTFSAVKIDKYYSRDEIGTVKTISIPISKFVSNDEDVYKINGGFDPSALSGAGLMLVNPQSEKMGYLYYDNLYICNVLAPTGLAVTDVSENSVSLSWQASDSEISGYAIYRDGKKIGYTDADTLEYRDENFEQMSNYKYTVRAVDQYGAESNDTNAVDFFASPIGRPEDFNAVSSFDDELSVKLSWTAPRYGNAETFNIYRNDELLTSVSGSEYEYTDTEGLVENGDYTYYIKAQTAGGMESMSSNVITLTATHIKKPANFKAETFSNERQVKLSWDTVDNAEGYIVECNGEILAKITENIGSYVHENISYSELYIYRVKAYNKNGVESLPTEEIYITVDHPEISQEGITIFGDSVGDGFNTIEMQSGAVKGKYTTVKDDAAKGGKSFDVLFTTGTSLLHGLSFEAAKEIDLSSMYNGRGILSMYVKADKNSVAKDIKIGLQCTSDTIIGSKYTVITSVPIADYIKTYGSWTYIEIPVSDFPSKGKYYHDAAALYTDFKFDKVTGLDFILEDISTQPINTVRFDEVMLSEYSAAEITGIKTDNGTVLDANAENTIDTATKEFDVDFAYQLNPETIKGITLTAENSDEIPVIAEYDGSKTVTVRVASPLKKDTKYILDFKNVYTANGAKLTSQVKFATSSNDAVIDEYTENGFNVKTSSVQTKSGNSANVDMLLTGDAAKAYVTGGTISLAYPKRLLSVSEKDIALSQPLEKAGVKANVSSGNITFDLNNINRPVLIGSLLASISFKASGSGSDSMETKGEVKVLSGSGEKTVSVKSEKANVTIEASSRGNASSGGGGSSSAGSREEGSGVKPTTPPAPINNPSNTDKALADASEVGWAKTAINYLTSNGYINGYEDNTFRPNNNVTREEFTAMLVRALKFEEKDSDTEFSDVNKDAWYYKSVKTAAALGIVTGYDGMFGVQETITRQDMCTMLYRAAQLADITIPDNYGSASFADDGEIAGYAKESIAALQRGGIVNGVEDNYFDPTGIVTRAMAAKVLYGLLTVQPNTEKTESENAAATDRSAGTVKRNESAERMKALGLIASADVTAETGENVTGSEFAKWLMNIMGLSNVYRDDKAVTGARELGYISDGDEFTADGALKYNTAVKMVMEALGYGVMAQHEGGYPSGYIAAAGSASVLKNTAPENDGTISRSNAIRILDNALEANLMDSDEKGSGLGSLEIKEDKNILNTYLKIDKYRGKIESANRNTKNVTFTANKETYTFDVADNINIYSVIADDADIYVKDDVIVYIYYRGTIQVMYDFIEEVNGDSDSGKEYSASGIKSIYLTNDAKSYNTDKKLTAYYKDKSIDDSSAPLAGSFAQITVKDGKVIEIQAYPLREGGILYHASRDMIKYKNGSKMSNTISGLADIDDLLIYVDGTPADSIELLAPDMVFDYYISEDEDKFIIVASSRTAVAAISSYGNSTVTADGKKYETSTEYGYYAYDNKSKRFKQCDGSAAVKEYLGKRAKLFIDDRKQLRYMLASETAINDNIFLGVITNAKYVDIPELITPSEVQMEVYNVSDGTGKKQYELAESVKNSPVSLEYAVKAARNVEGKGFFKFTLNSEGKIAKIETPQYWGNEFTYSKEITNKTPYIIGQICVKYATLFAVCNVDGEFTVTPLDWDTDLRQTNFGGGVTVISDYDAANNPIPEYVMFAKGSENLQSNNKAEWITNINYLEDDKAELTMWNMWGTQKYIVDAKTAEKYTAPSLVEYRSRKFQADQVNISNVLCSGSSDTWKTGTWTGMNYGFFSADKILYSDDEVVQFQVDGQPTNVMHLAEYFYVIEYIDGKKPTIKRQTGQMPMGYINDGDKIWFRTVKYDNYDINVEVVVYEKNGIAPKG